VYRAQFHLRPVHPPGFQGVPRTFPEKSPFGLVLSKHGLLPCRRKPDRSRANGGF